MCFLFSSCEFDTRLVLVNQTSKTIRYLDETKAKGDTIPDMTQCETIVPYRVFANSKEIISSLNQWDVFFKQNPDKILRIYIMSEDSLSKYGTCKVLRQQIFLRRIDITYNDLKKSNWEVVYE